MSPLTPSILSLLICYCVTVHCLTDRGSIQVGGIGTLHVAGGNCGVTVKSNTITLAQNCAPRVYLTSGSSYYRFQNMLGKSIQFTVELSKAGCGCNAAVYFVDVPHGKQPEYYCDAQCPNGQCCNEIDIFEANTHAMASTLHCSDGSNPCKWGYGANFKSAAGYGLNAKINTYKPFDVIMSFVEANGKLSAVKIKLVQGSNVVSSTLVDSGYSMRSGYVSGLTSAMSSGRLVMAISYWSGDMSWLDGCGAHCDTSGNNQVSFSNFKVLGNAAMTDDEVAYSSSFVVSSSFFAVIALSVLVVVLAIIIVVVVIKKRNAIETV